MATTRGSVATTGRLHVLRDQVDPSHNGVDIVLIPGIGTPLPVTWPFANLEWLTIARGVFPLKEDDINHHRQILQYLKQDLGLEVQIFYLALLGSGPGAEILGIWTPREQLEEALIVKQNNLVRRVDIQSDDVHHETKSTSGGRFWHNVRERIISCIILPYAALIICFGREKMAQTQPDPLFALLSEERLMPTAEWGAADDQRVSAINRVLDEMVKPDLRLSLDAPRHKVQMSDSQRKAEVENILNDFATDYG